MRKVKESSFIVYQHTNLINGKIYVGITALETEDRWRKGNGYYSNTHFYNAIQKYGWDNFKHEILFSNLTQEEACKIEIELIAFHKSNLSEFGYNGSTGGEYGHSGCKHSIESRKKMSENHANFRGANSKQSIPIICLDTKEIFASIGEAGRKLNITITGIHHVLKGKLKSYHGLHFIYLKDYNPDEKYDLSIGCTEESLKKISEANKGKPAWNKGKKHSFESIEKMRKAKLGKKASIETKNKMSEAQKHIGCRQIICTTTGELFESISECARKFNLSTGNISAVCQGKRKHTRGLHFKYYIGEK